MSNLLNISAMVVLFDLGLDAQDFINKLFPNGWEPLVVQLLAFGVLVLAGVFLAYKPVKKLLNERASYVEKNIKEAEEKNSAAFKLQQEAEDNIVKSQKEARSIINEAKKDAIREHDEMIAQTKVEIQNSKLQADKEIAKSKEKALDDIHNEIVNVALDASKVILNREINEEDNSRLIEDFIKEVDK